MPRLSPVKTKATGILRSLIDVAERKIADETDDAPSADETHIADEANWLDLEAEEPRAFDEKLQFFLSCEVGNDRERQWLLPGS